jgi:hypothetical protein
VTTTCVASGWVALATGTGSSGSSRRGRSGPSWESIPQIPELCTPPQGIYGARARAARMDGRGFGGACGRPPPVLCPSGARTPVDRGRDAGSHSVRGASLTTIDLLRPIHESSSFVRYPAGPTCTEEAEYMYKKKLNTATIRPGPWVRLLTIRNVFGVRRRTYVLTLRQPASFAGARYTTGQQTLPCTTHRTYECTTMLAAASRARARTRTRVMDSIASDGEETPIYIYIYIYIYRAPRTGTTHS